MNKINEIIEILQEYGYVTDKPLQGEYMVAFAAAEDIQVLFDDKPKPTNILKLVE